MSVLKKVTPIRSLQPIFDMLHQEHQLMLEEDDDRTFLLCGNVGSGKSLLGLTIFQYWNQQVLKHELKPSEMMQYFATSDEVWVAALVSSKNIPCNMIAHDEAINIIYSKEATKKENRSIQKTFNKIRGKKYFHLFLIPQPQRVDNEFRSDRVQAMLYVFKENGKRYVAVYSKARIDTLFAELKRMIESSASDVVRRPNVLNCDTMPTFICEIPKYDGILLEIYKKLKEQNMDNSIDELADLYESQKAKSMKARNKLIVAMGAEQITQKKIANVARVTQQRVSSILREQNPTNNHKELCIEGRG